MAIDQYSYTPRSAIELPEEWGRAQGLAVQCQGLIRLLGSSGYQLRIYTGHKVDSWKLSVEFVLARRAEHGDKLIAKCTEPDHAEGVLRMLLVELEDLIEAERHEYQKRYKTETVQTRS